MSLSAHGIFSSHVPQRRTQILSSAAVNRVTPSSRSFIPKRELKSRMIIRPKSIQAIPHLRTQKSPFPPSFLCSPSLASVEKGAYAYEAQCCWNVGTFFGIQGTCDQVPGMMLATTFGSLEYVHMCAESPIEPVSSLEYDGVAAYLLASFNDKLASPFSSRQKFVRSE